MEVYKQNHVLLKVFNKSCTMAACPRQRNTLQSSSQQGSLRTQLQYLPLTGGRQTKTYTFRNRLIYSIENSFEKISSSAKTCKFILWPTFRSDTYGYRPPFRMRIQTLLMCLIFSPNCDHDKILKYWNHRHSSLKKMQVNLPIDGPL